ncbi:MAG: hypothetical protein IJQ81_12050 [Oscillibacter sp.]|nr:hypothetical protein [Oscillibacter sp.]
MVANISALLYSLRPRIIISKNSSLEKQDYIISDALYGLMITLSDIEESLDSLGCDSRKETRT